MSRAEARETLGITALDEVCKDGLESLKQAEVRLLEYTKDQSEQSRIKITIKAINTLLKLKDYVA